MVVIDQLIRTRRNQFFIRRSVTGHKQCTGVDMSNSNRRFGRSVRPSQQANLSSSSATSNSGAPSQMNTGDTPSGQTNSRAMPSGGYNSYEDLQSFAPLPKHIAFPDVPHQSELVNELMLFGFTSIAACTQFLSLYRTVWWLPESYTDQTINLYLVNVHLAIFIFTMLGRRALYCLLSQLVELICPVRFFNTASIVLRVTYMTGLLIALAYCSVKIFQEHSYMYIFCLCYPLCVYVIIFGFKIGPFLKTINPTESTYLNGNPMHCCTTNASGVRSEVEILRTDFNNRSKQVIFTSVVNAYYAGFLPFCFAQNYLYYNIYWATQQMGFIWVGGFTMSAIYCFPAKYCDVMHRAALHLGQWKRITHAHITSQALVWQKTTIWPPGTLVKHCGDFFMATGPNTTAIPADNSHHRFYGLFRNPSRLYLVLVCIQVALVGIQLFILSCTVEWHHTISLSYLLLTNYHTLFKVIRDYLVTHKVYAAETSVYEKINPGQMAD